MPEIFENCCCKGIRFCNGCVNTERVSNLNINQINNLRYKNYRFYYFINNIGKAVYDSNLTYKSLLLEIKEKVLEYQFKKDQDLIEISGIKLIKNFISSDTENYLIKKIDSQQWFISQSGRRKQDYGPKINFKKQKVQVETFKGIPEYVDLFLNDLKVNISDENDANKFDIFEMCNLEYVENKSSSIAMHKDDDWIWGERLVSINLLNDTVMSFEDKNLKRFVFVYLPRRSMICISGEARNNYMHGIFSYHIVNRRIAITIRESSQLFKKGGKYYEQYGKDLIKRSKIRILI